MRMSWLVCVLLGAMAWGQAAPGAPAEAQPSPMQAPGLPKPAASTAETAAAVPATAAVITVNGVCPAQPKTAAAKGAAAKPATAKTPATDCKTVITKAEFEKIADAVSPNVTPQLKQQLAGVLPRFIAMSDAAKKQGLDKTPQFQEMMKFARMQILTNELQRSIQEKAAKVPEADIDSYYKDHSEAYEQFNLDRLFVPRTKQVQADAKDKDEDKNEKLTEEQEKAKQAEEKAKAEENEQAMSKLAEDLRARAAAGEDFAKLQKEAFEAAGMKIESPTVNLPKVRRTGLPPAHAAVFELKAGDVSQVINDNGGHYIYKVVGKDQLTLAQVKDEIENQLKSQRTREMMEKVNNSFQVEKNEAYFGPNTPMPQRRVPNPRMPAGAMPPPGAAAPAPAAQTPAPAQPPAAKPN
jgi:hypothetical protein